MLDPAGRLSTDVRVVVGLAPNHRSQTDHGRKPAGLGRVLGDQRELECAGNLEPLDLLDGCLGKSVVRTRLEPVGQLRVEAGDA